MVGRETLLQKHHQGDAIGIVKTKKEAMNQEMREAPGRQKSWEQILPESPESIAAQQHLGFGSRCLVGDFWSTEE